PHGAAAPAAQLLRRRRQRHRRRSAAQPRQVRHRRVKQLTHFDDAGAARMVEVGAKPETARVAVASGTVAMAPATARAIARGKIGKGDVLGIARLAGIQGAKRASDLIPLCHPLRLTGVDLELRVVKNTVRIAATVRAFDRTGVEMEALAA